jgi:hypothetical protein
MIGADKREGFVDVQNKTLLCALKEKHYRQ